MDILIAENAMREIDVAYRNIVENMTNSSFNPTRKFDLCHPYLDTIFYKSREPFDNLRH